MSGTGATILVIGGYGVFGSRLSRALAREPGIDLVVAGRDITAAQRFCAANGGRPETLDRDGPDLDIHLRAIAPLIVVDAAGPFQGYGDNPYRLARTAIAAGAHYLDLSDHAAFTVGISDLDGQARAAGRVVLSGASSVPALSSAAVAALLPGMSDIHLIESAILPGNRAPRGLSVVRAILSQAGRPLAFWRTSRIETLPGWSDAQPVTIDLGDGTPSLRRPASLIGAPDLTLFPGWTGARSVSFRAGLELGLLHRGLAMLSLSVRWRLVRNLAPLAPALLWIAGRMEHFGSDRGGMRVRVLGLADGVPEIRDWLLMAEAGDGPEVPAIPALLLCRAILSECVEPGARPALAAFSLAEVGAELGRHAIRTARRTERFLPLFRQALGEGFDLLPPVLRDLHMVLHLRRWSGQGTVTRGRSLLARLVATVMGFPPAGIYPVTVTMRRKGQGEVWQRQFGRYRFVSHLKPRPGGGITERFGPMTFDIGLAASATGLRYPVTAGRLLGLPIPCWLLPVSETVEGMDDQGRATFDVALSHPWTGPIVRYHGWLVDDEGLQSSREWK